MIANQRYRKVPCGGRILEREADAHIKRCEMCEAFLDYKREKFNHLADVGLVIAAIAVVIFVVWLWQIF